MPRKKKTSEEIIESCAPDAEGKTEVNKVLENCKSLISVDVSEIKSLSELEKERQKNGEEACQSTINFIKSSIQKLASEFVYIGFKLFECESRQEFRFLGYETIADFALNELGFKKSTTYNFIRVYKRFADKLPGVEAFQVTHQYKNFSYSQLCEMLSLSDQQIEAADIRPTDSVRDIKAKKKSLLQASELSEQEDQEEQIEMIVKENKRINVELLEDEAVTLLKLIEKAELSEEADFCSARLLQELRNKLYIKVGEQNAV